MPPEDDDHGARDDEPSRLERPVRHSTRAGRDTPLIVVEGGGAPDLDGLARRVARQVAAAALPPSAPGGFGMRQRWYPTHLIWPPTTAPAIAVARPRFIPPEDVAAWREAPPDDALPLELGCDGLIDGRTQVGATCFYAVLTGGGPWEPVAIAPAAPPFDRPHAPCLLGEALARLEAAVLERLEAVPPGADPLLLQLLSGLARHLPADSAARSRLAARTE